MASSKNRWKKGRGKLGILAPLVGTWCANAASSMGPVTCTRTFSTVLGGKYVELRADWSIGKTNYQELAIYGFDADTTLRFWSFTSDGKKSQGTLADVTDLHPQAVGFEAQMPAGLARIVYWPHEEHGMIWVVESKTKKGWNRFVTHRYLRQSSPNDSCHDFNFQISLSQMTSVTIPSFNGRNRDNMEISQINFRQLAR